MAFKKSILTVDTSDRARIDSRQASRVQGLLFWVATLLVAVVPLTFSTALYRSYSLPKFALLLVCSSVLLALLLVIAVTEPKALRVLRSQLVLLVLFYLAAVALSSVLGVAPYVSVLGSFENQMGLVSQVCFFIVLVALVVGIGHSRARFRLVVWAMTLAGLLTAIYAVAQSAGFDPFVPSRLYTYRAGADSVIRAIGGIGHADFLGNFLMYTTLLSVGVALESTGRARRIALAGGAVSVVAIALSGTRGAWLGLVAGSVVFGTLEMRRWTGAKSNMLKSVRIWLFALVGAAVVIGLISLSPASQTITARSRSFMAERMTGAGRTVLWRDSLRMVPAYALVGCGSEGFRKAFLAYKSVDLARMTGKIENESSHNSYLDAVISYGIIGAALYGAVVMSALGLLLRVRRLAGNGMEPAVLTGILASFVAALVHKMFIFDLIPTGLYFFAFVGLAVSAWNFTRATGREGDDESPHEPVVTNAQVAIPAGDSGLRVGDYKVWGVGVFGLVIVGAAVWYSTSLLRADVEIKRTIVAAAAADFDGVFNHGQSAVRAPDPAGGYHFLFSRALADCATKRRAAAKGAGQTGSQSGPADGAIGDGIAEAEKSIERSGSPDSGYVLLCYLASAREDYEALRDYAAEAIRWDSRYGPARAYLAEAYLGQGNLDDARIEMAAWIDLRKRGASGGESQRQKRVQRFIARASNLAEQGKAIKARLELLKASIAAGEGCAGCHKGVALACEGVGFKELAAEEWRRVIDLNPGAEDLDDARQHIDSLSSVQKQAAPR